MVSLGVMPPSGSAITCYAFQATSVTGDLWVSSGQRKLAIEDLTTKKQEARWVTFSRLLYLFCYGDLLFSSKEPQENSLKSLVFKKALGLLKDSFVSSACWSPFSGALSDKCSKAAMAEWTSNTPGGWSRSCRRFWKAWLTVFWEIFDFTTSILRLTLSTTSWADLGITQKRRRAKWFQKGAGKLKHRKIPKISPGAYIFQRPFLRGLYSEGLI